MITTLYEKDIIELVRQKFPKGNIVINQYGSNEDGSLNIEIEQEVLNVSK